MYINNWTRRVMAFSDTLKIVKYTPLSIVFSPVFSMLKLRYDTRTLVSYNISKQLIARQRQLIVRSVFNPGNFETLKSNEALSLVREIAFQALA